MQLWALNSPLFAFTWLYSQRKEGLICSIGFLLVGTSYVIGNFPEGGHMLSGPCTKPVAINITLLGRIQMKFGEDGLVD